MAHWCKKGDEVALVSIEANGEKSYRIGKISKISKTGLIYIRNYGNNFSVFYPTGMSKNDSWDYITPVTDEIREKIKYDNRIAEIVDTLAGDGFYDSHETYNWFNVSDEKLLQIAEILGI